MGKVELNKQKKRESLLDSAFQLFTNNGFSKTSVSDIVNHAGVAKGTFYLYFADKFDLRNKLIASQADKLFLAAYSDLQQQEPMSFEDEVIFMVNHILDQFTANPALVTFISKHLSWALFKITLLGQGDGSASRTYQVYRELLDHSGRTFRSPEIMLYMILEFVSGTSYNAILYRQPCSLEELKPELFDVIRYIIRRQELPGGEDVDREPLPV